MIHYPRYDVTTREIKRVEDKNSLIYFHEYRHKLQHDKDWFTNAFLVTYFLEASWVLILTVLNMTQILKTTHILGLGTLIPFLVMIYIEIDAWFYAFRKRFAKDYE